MAEPRTGGERPPQKGKGRQSAARANSSIWLMAGIPGLASPVGRSADGRPEWSQLGPAGQLLQLWEESTNRSRTGIVPHPTHPRPHVPPPLFSPAGGGKPLEVTEKGGIVSESLPPFLHGPQLGSPTDDRLPRNFPLPTSCDGHSALHCACCPKAAVAETLWDLPHQTCGIAEPKN